MQVGGFDCFLSADKDGEAATAEVYRPNKEEDNDLLSICAITNTLNLVRHALWVQSASWSFDVVVSRQDPLLCPTIASYCLPCITLATGFAELGA